MSKAISFFNIFSRNLSLHYSILTYSYLHYEYLVGSYTRSLPLCVFIDKTWPNFHLEKLNSLYWSWIIQKENPKLCIWGLTIKVFHDKYLVSVVMQITTEHRKRKENSPREHDMIWDRKWKGLLLPVILNLFIVHHALLKLLQGVYKIFFSVELPLSRWDSFLNN